MNNTGLIAYLLVSYSIGLASLVVSLASYLERRGKVARDFLLASLVLAAIGSKRNGYQPFQCPPRLVAHYPALPFGITCARRASSVVLPLLVHSVYRTDPIEIP